MRVFRITLQGVKLDLALTEQGDSKSNSRKARAGLHMLYVMCLYSTEYTKHQTLRLKHLIRWYMKVDPLQQGLTLLARLFSSVVLE